MSNRDVENKKALAGFSAERSSLCTNTFRASNRRNTVVEYCKKLKCQAGVWKTKKPLRASLLKGVANAPTHFAPPIVVIQL